MPEIQQPSHEEIDHIKQHLIDSGNTLSASELKALIESTLNPFLRDINGLNRETKSRVFNLLIELSESDSIPTEIKEDIRDHIAIMLGV
jgi:hypothetical protein